MTRKFLTFKPLFLRGLYWAASLFSLFLLLQNPDGWLAGNEALGAASPSIHAIEKKLEAREREMRELKSRLLKNKARLSRYKGRRLKLKVRILKLRVSLESFHLQVERLQIREIQDRQAIKGLDRAMARLGVVVSADLRQKNSLESRLLLRTAEVSLSRLDGTDIQPETILRSNILSDQTHHLETLLHDYRNREDRLKLSRAQLKIIQNHEKRLLKRREKEESLLKKKMSGIELEIARLKKKETDLAKDNRSILKRRRELMNLIARLERMRRLSHRHETFSHPPVLGHTMFMWPVRGKIVEKYGTFHDGIDIAAPVGSRVHAAWRGKVLFARAYSGYGRLVILAHGDHLYTLYGHLDHIFAREGQPVPEGGIIGTVGRGGTRGQSTLFFGVTRRGKPMSPMGFLAR